MCVQRLNWFLRARARSSVPRILRQVPIASADRTTSSSDPTGYPRPPDDGSSVAVCALAIDTFFLQQRRSHHEVSLEDSALPHLLLLDRLAFLFQTTHPWERCDVMNVIFPSTPNPLAWNAVSPLRSSALPSGFQAITS
ncbi:hypothetical protein Bbelb_018910 [Branchiostoma belcheri]|nr:hypothetical protein Bbelb_018910 [Branchiostoma belcheri]